MARLNWDQMLIESRFDTRGARLEWKRMRIRTAEGTVRPGLVFNAPPWIRTQLEPELRRRSLSKARLKKHGSQWMYAYILKDEIDEAFARFLEVLTENLSIGNKLARVTHCLALDFYKKPSDSVDPMAWPNTHAGELVHRSKYWDPPASVKAFHTLTRELAALSRYHPQLNSASCVISIPGRDSRTVGHGEKLARAVATQVGKPFHRTKAKYVRRPAAKEGTSLVPEQVEVSPNVFLDDVVIIVDDVFRSGESMAAVATKAHEMCAREIYGLVGARTLRN